jgi:hypothetical protein
MTDFIARFAGVATLALAALPAAALSTNAHAAPAAAQVAQLDPDVAAMRAEAGEPLRR